MSGKKLKIIVGIEFNSRANGISRTKDWIDYRMDIFNKFTLQSLKKQTNQDFLVLVRYAEKTTDLIKGALSHYPTLPNNIRFIENEKYESIIEKSIKGYEFLYLVRLDCDDVYHKTFINQLHEYKPKKNTRALINQKGYVYDSVNHRLGNWYYVSPPFYTLIYKVKDYLAGERVPIPKGHCTVIKNPHEIIHKKNYAVIVHGNNTLNAFNNHRTGKIITNKKEIQNILKHFI
ncbi:putative rhamnosyl transferase [Clostridium aceticum]|uniref:Putative rhamnosyl transferase n=1 Tax=Clostridium aceticum TaxID=84022 RepID=A0A0G3WBF1_9CLOT|nr:glycosyltransferase [Clostridium aceticum]AKL95220.1 putative rhamnosyl transferase [Clostridium aceticum]